MSFSIQAGPRGLTALWNGKLLSSAYAPDREAHSWAERVTAAPGSLVFVAGDPWGLACQALANRGIRAVALVPGTEALPHVPASIEVWAPGDQSLESFLEGVFDTTGPEGVVWEVWPALERLAPELVLDWSQRFRNLFRTVQGSWLTQKRFGARFWTNALRNFIDWEVPARPQPGSRPLVIAASGPSLDDGMALMAQHRDQFDLWALPSSFETLVRRGLLPEAGVATDGGFYAREHLHRLAGTTIPVLAALTSAPDPVLSRRPCFFFRQGFLVETLLAEAAGLGLPEVPSQGTVAVTALRLALEATSGPVFIAGLDLSFRDLRGHTSPHTVDRRSDTVHHRLAPSETYWASRLLDQGTVVEQGVRTSPALLTYALWFRTRARFSRPVYRIAPSALRWDTMSEVSWDQAARLWATAPWTAPVRWPRVGSWPTRSERLRAAVSALDTLADRTARAGDADPWLVEAARTAVPEALAQDFRARRTGGRGTAVRPAMAEFVSRLRKGLE